MLRHWVVGGKSFSLPQLSQFLAALLAVAAAGYLVWKITESGDQALQFTFNGLSVGAAYALLAMGFTLVYSTVWFFDMYYEEGVMQRLSRSSLPLIALLGVLVLLVGACDGGGDDTYKIGVMESVTGPGETYGNVAVQAKEMAVAEINEAGGINGRMIELLVEDSKCSSADAITAYNKLTDVDGIKIILGTSCSGAMLGAAPRAEEDGVILFSGLATNPDIANAGDYIFRTSMNDLQVGEDTGNVLWADGIRVLATITESTDYAEGVRRTSIEQFEKRGGEVVASEFYASDIIDFRSQLTKLLSENPDAIHVASQAEASGGTIVKQARELGYEGPIYGDIVVAGTTAQQVAGAAADGVKAIIADIDPANAKAQEVIENFRARYDYVTLPWFLGSAYDDVYITAECLKQTGDDQDADGLRDCLYDITWSGTIGTDYSFDDQGEVVGLSNVVVEVLPLAERSDENFGYRVLGDAPSE